MLKSPYKREFGNRLSKENCIDEQNTAQRLLENQRVSVVTVVTVKDSKLVGRVSNHRYTYDRVRMNLNFPTKYKREILEESG